MINKMANIIQPTHSEDHCCGSHSHGNGESVAAWKRYTPAIFSFLLLLTGIFLDNLSSISFFSGYLRLAWYIIAYIPVGFPVIKEAYGAIKEFDFFNEFTLMVIATLGAFFIGEYPEGVAVMLFYSVGELFQESAVNKAKSNIKALLDIRPDKANVLRSGTFQAVSPETVAIGEIIQVKAGEKIPLDGVLLSESGSFNTSALTGESKPKTIREGEKVLAGMLNLDKVIEIKVEKKYTDSSLAKILEMVQDATSRKAKTELLIRKFARIYTPIVFFLALVITVIPYFVVSNYVFNDWLYRALVFLVISCPCALVISIPLGYFGGIGAASRHGILFKGANYMDLMTSVNTVVMDKTGTLTKGVFKVQRIVCPAYDPIEFMRIVAAVEKLSTHPIAKAIVEHSVVNGKSTTYKAKDVKEITGYGLQGYVDGKKVIIGNSKMMRKYGIEYDTNIDSIIESVVIVALDNRYAGYITIADELKEDSLLAISEMHNQGIKTIMLSGDKSSITQKTAGELGVDSAYGDLLPEDKVRHVEQLKSDKANVVAFVGDGINDAPVLALSDIGIVMGGMGSDAAIEVADVVIQTDHPSKITTAIRIAKSTKQIVIQNITLAFGVKLVVLSFGAVGVATMWEAVFADVGVALLAILNAMRILRKNF